MKLLLLIFSFTFLGCIYVNNKTQTTNVKNVVINKAIEPMVCDKPKPVTIVIPTAPSLPVISKDINAEKVNDILFLHIVELRAHIRKLEKQLINSSTIKK